MSAYFMKESKDGTGEKPCRACMDFKSWMKNHGKSRDPNGEEIPGMSRSFNVLSLHNHDEYGGKGTSKKYQTLKSGSHSDPDVEFYPKWGLAAKYGCPADSVSLGRGTWRLLHSMAAYYPEKPDVEVKKDMGTFISVFSKFYPCPPCAEDFRKWITNHPPNLESRFGLSQWFCQAHNEVNRKLGKPEFDCSLVKERWEEGWKDGSCD